MKPGERKAIAGLLLLILALALFFTGTYTPQSANEGVIRAVYGAAAAILVGMAILAWASE